MILLDTQVLYWWAVEPQKLGKNSLELIASSKIVLVSPISLFELLQKQRSNKLSPKLDVMNELMVPDFDLEPLTSKALEVYKDLPKLPWQDPFDHLLIAQAVSSGAALITADRQILSCKVNNLQTSDARK